MSIAVLVRKNVPEYKGYICKEGDIEVAIEGIMSEYKSRQLEVDKDSQFTEMVFPITPTATQPNQSFELTVKVTTIKPGTVYGTKEYTDLVKIGKLYILPSTDVNDLVLTASQKAELNDFRKFCFDVRTTMEGKLKKHNEDLQELNRQLVEDNKKLRQKNGKLLQKLRNQFFSGMIRDMSEVHVELLVKEISAHPIFKKHQNQ